MRFREHNPPSSVSSRQQLLLLLTLGCCSGFLHPHTLSSQSLQTSLSAVQVDPRKAARQRVLSLEEDAASRLDKLLKKTPQDPNVLKEIAGRIEILCEADDDGTADNSANDELPTAGKRTEPESTSADEEAAQERRKLAARAALLGSRSSQGKPHSAATRATSRTSTSVGEKRVGSASKARQGPGMTKRIMDAVRKSASSNKPKEDYDNTPNPTNSPPASMSAASVPLNRKLTPSGIHSAVMELMDRQRRDSTNSNSFDSVAWEEPPQLLQPPCEQQFCKTPPPGTVLIPASEEFINKDDQKLQFPDCVTVRVAHGLQAQDTEVANLRLSVFSDFSPEVRRQLVSRSVNAVVTRRMKGATCLVATVPPSLSARKRNRPPVILGSAECSFHEFEGTTLGHRRPEKSILYITEVAVSPNARRRGIGRKLLEAIDILGNLRGIETLYLHVDVENESAITLYEKAGFKKVNSSEPMFLEFTTKLNLHDGATKGRNHYLLYKDMVECPTWLPEQSRKEELRLNLPKPAFYEPAMGKLGFQVPC